MQNADSDKRADHSSEVSVDRRPPGGVTGRRGLLGEIRNQSPVIILVVGLVLILLIGFVNFWIGPRVSGSLFYLFPVLFVSHFAGRPAGVVAALIATGIWLTTDLVDASAYSHPFIPYWNALMRLGVFLIVVWLVSSMRALNATLERRVEDRTARLQAEIQERMNLERRILEISEREQARIGQDLHDGLCQHLVGTTFSANLLKERLAAKGMPESADAAQIAALLDESITQARSLARGLHPVRLEDQGLATALQELVDGVNARFNVQCALVCKGDERDLADEVAIHLYRIAQEAITNAIKHAKARRINVSLDVEKSHFELRVDDDGIGLAVERSRPESMGLHIMEYRARMIDARFSVQSQSAGGTRVICASPSTDK